MASDPALEPLEPFSAPPPASTLESDSGGDPALRSLEPFSGPSSPEIQYTPDWNQRDIALGLKAGAHIGVAAPVFTGLSAMSDTQEGKRYWADYASQQRKYAEENEAEMTPGATKTMPVWMAEQAAPIAAQAIPIAMAGPLGFGTEAAALGAGAVTGGVMATSQYRSDVAGAIDKASHEELMKDPQYAFEVNNGVPEDKARFNLTQRSYSTARDLGVGALGAFAGGISAPVMSAAANPLLRVLDPSARGLIGVALRGGITAGEATVPIATQMTGQAYATQQAAHEASAGPAPTVESVWPDTRALALAGGIGFGAGALKAPYHPGIDVKPREPSKTTTATAAEPGKATSVGSSREGAKPKEEEKLGVKELDAAGNQPAAPPPPPEQQTETSAGPEVSAALEAVARTEGGGAGVGERPTTPESTKPQPSPVNTTQVAQNAQPVVEMPQDQQGRPPAGVEAPPVSIPMEAPREPPAAQPVASARPETAPAPGAEPTVPEDQASLSAQQKEIKSGDRNFAYYPPGTAPPPHLTGVNRAVVQDGDVIRVPYGKKGDLTNAQVFDFSPKVKEPLDKIKFALDNDRLHELLQLGPVSKTDTEARVNAGETPIVVTTRDEAGNELKAATGTTETAPAQVQALETGKASPEHVVQVERPEDVIADRFAKTRAENVAREQAQAPQKVVPTGRTLESTRPEDLVAAAHTAAIEAHHAQIIEERLKARQAEKAAEEKAAAEGQKTGKHWTKEQIAEINKVNRVADNVTAAHRVKVYNDPKAVFDSAKMMVDAAKKAGIEIPGQFNEGHPYNDNVVRLREAADLVESAKQGRKALEEGLGRFIHRDSLIDAGKVNEALENRRAEGAAMMGAPEGAGEGVRVAPKGGAVDEEGRTLEEREGAVHEEPTAFTPKSEEEIGGVVEHAPIPEYLKEGIRQTRQDADRMGVTRDIERLSAEGKTAQQVVNELNRTGVDTTFVRAVRADLGIPSMEERDAFDAWKAKYDAKHKEGEGYRTGKFAPKSEEEETFTPASKFGMVERTPEERAAAREKIDQDEYERKRNFYQKVLDNPRYTEVQHQHARDQLADLEQERKEREGEAYRVAKPVTAGFQVEKKRGRFQREGMEEESTGNVFSRLLEASKSAEKGERPSEVTVTLDDGSKVTVRPSRTTNVATVIKENYGVGQYVKGAPQIMGKLRDLIVKLVGDRPVYYVTHEELKQITGGDAYGAHTNEHGGIIFLNSDYPSASTPLHEAFHAAIAEGLRKFPEFRDNMEKLRVEVLKSLPKDLTTGNNWRAISYYMSGHEEFLNGMMTNPKMQELLKGIKISKELAKELGIPQWRKMTMWEGALSIIRQALGLTPRDTSAIEAAMAITEETMWQHPRGTGELMEAAGRLARSQMEHPERPRFQLDRMSSDAESTLGGDKVEGRLDKLVPDFAKSVTADLKTNTGYYARKGMLKILAPTQIAGFARKMFMDKESAKTGSSILDDLNHSVEARHQEFAKLNEADRGFLAKSYHLAKQFSEHMNDFGRLLDMSGKYGIHADLEAPKERTKVEQGAMEDWQAVHYGPETRALLASMPDELREHYTELKEFYKEKAQALAKAHIQNVLDIFDPVDKNNLKSAIERNERVNRVLAHNMTDEDKAYYRNLPGNKNVVTEINKLYGFLNPKGVYFNAYRDGDFTVTGRYAMPTGGNDTSHSGEELPDNVREFDTRKEAHEFATSTEMRATPSIVRYVKDPDNPGQFLDHLLHPDTSEPMGISAQDADVTHYRVALQREHTEMGRTPAQAERAREEMIKLGVKNVSQVLDKRKEENWTQLNNANAKAFERSINDRDDLSRTEKRKLIDASRQLGLMTQSGNRMAKHWTTRRNISGANYNEIYEAAHNYANASNFHMANAKVSGDIDKAMTRLDKHEESTRESDNAYQISSIVNHMRDRVYAGPDSLSPRTPTWLRALKVMAFSKYLLTPRFIVQHQLHPLAFTAPQMAGRHGYMNAVGYLWHALSDVGGNIPNIGEGFKASGRMAKALLGGGSADIDARIAAGKPLDMVDRIIAKISAKSSREGDALRALQKGGALHSGFDDEFYGASGLDKVDLLMRQTTNAMEATNRTVAGLGAYRAEYDRLVNAGKSSQTAHEGAIQYAQQTIENSMGVFSPTNMANMFKHPYLRAALQFKQFPLQQTYAFLRNVHDAFSGETPEVKKEAVRAATAQMLSASVMTGVHGLPLLGVLKAGGLLGMALGVTPSPSQIDDRTYRLLADKLSPSVAKAIMTGPLSALSPYMPDVSNVFGYAGDFFYGEPHNNDWKSYAWDTLAGAPGSAAGDTWSGMGDMWHGDMAKGISKLAPIGAISNLARAFTLGTEGAQTTKGLQITPASPEAAMLKVLGFTTQQQSRAYGGRQALEEDIQEAKDQKTQALDQARKGNMAAVLKWNNANPHDRISPQQASQARKGQSAQSILGVKITPRNRARLEEFQVYQ